MNYGFIHELMDLRAYVLDPRVPYIPFNESGNWEDWLPTYENQTTKLGDETNGCTCHGSLNQLEILEKFLYQGSPNYAERFPYLNIPIDPRKGGTDPQNAYEAIRKHGVVDERVLPMTDTIEAYLDQSDMTGSVRAKGQNWLGKHDYRHEWLWRNRPNNYMEIIKDTLTTSPIAVSVSAWIEENGVYVSNGLKNNHFCVLYKIDEEGYPWVFDSYDHSKKRLSKNHDIRVAKRIFLNKKTYKGSKTLLSILEEYVKILTMKPTLYDITKKYLGTDVTPADRVDDSEACAEVVSTLIREIDPTMKIITGTWTLNDFLSKSPKWKKLNEPKKGCVIISPTGTGTGSGHTGIVMENNLIASNNSFGINKGKITENYTVQTWFQKFGVKQRMPTYYYEYLG